MNIVRDENDKWRFMQTLRFFNDSNSSLNVLRQIQDMLTSDVNNNKGKGNKGINKDNIIDFESVFNIGWPKNWPEKDPLVKILCYCLVPNHFHLLLKEIREGGVSRFMQKLGIGFAKYFNIKYNENGNLFEGSYKGKTVEGQKYLEYLSVYIQIINILRVYPGGIRESLRNLDKFLKFAEEYPFSSYRDYIGLRKSLIIDKDVLGGIFTPERYKKFVRDTIENKKYELLKDLMID